MDTHGPGSAARAARVVVVVVGVLFWGRDEGSKSFSSGFRTFFRRVF